MRPKYKVDLARLHDVWSANYVVLICLLPQLRDQNTPHVALCGSAPVNLEVVERGPHTIIVDIRPRELAAADTTVGHGSAESVLLHPNDFHFRLRVYHDARMAEVIASGGHRYLKARYDYPNPDMYQRDEKFQLNCLFSDWLKSCMGHESAVALAATANATAANCAPCCELPVASKIAPREQ